MKLTTILYAAAMVVTGVAHGQVTVTKDYVISVRPEASAVERTAAGELQGYLKKSMGVEMAVKVGATGDQVIDVRTDDRLGEDGVRVGTEGKRVVIAGGGKRGVIYAADSFLEDVAGVRWWTSSEEVVPGKKALTVGDRAIEHTPRILYRECYNYDPMHSGEFAARLKLNGHHMPVPAGWGGHYSIIGWCHTSFGLVPPGQWFAKHPEWYAMDKNGKRGTAQVCWSDPGLRAEMARAVLARIRKNPEAGMISVSQEDGPGPCQCDKCRAIAKEDGTEAGPLLRGVNAVAAEVAKEYPNFLVETLAYQWSRKPPKVTRPAKNVLIRLCSIEADFSHPLEGESFGRDLRDWSKIADHLFVWNYVTNFANYLIPQPNWWPIGKDLEFFAENHVVGVFEQGDAYNYPMGDMLPMRVWVQAHLLWDPRRDERGLTKEFLNGYYGAAGPYLMEYVDLVNARSADKGFKRGCYAGKADFMSADDLERAIGLFDRAAAAVRGDAVLSKRVAVQRLIVDHVRLEKWYVAGDSARQSAKTAWREYQSAADAFIKGAEENGGRMFSEMLGFSAYPSTLKAAGMKGAPVELPKAGEKLGAGKFDVQEDKFTLYRKGDLTDIVDDPKASNGKAARMRGGHTEWAIQMHVAKGAPYVGKGPWKVYVVARVAGDGGGHAFTMGVYNNKGGMKARREVGDATGEYKTFGFVMDRLEEGDYVWLSPGGGRDVYVDRVFIEKGD